MSSYLRNLRRKHLRKYGLHTPLDLTIQHEDHVDVYHPTKGFRSVSMKRFAAQTAMAQMLDHVIPARRKKGRKVYREEAIRRAAGTLLRRRFPAQETRQQRRANKRMGIAPSA